MSKRSYQFGLAIKIDILQEDNMATSQQLVNCWTLVIKSRYIVRML